MSRIDMERNAIMMFMEYMENNIFCTRNDFKIKKKVKISNTFPIYIKNLNEFEIEYIRKNNYKKLFSIVSAFPNIQYIFQVEDYLINDKYYAFKEKIYQIIHLYEEYIKKNDNIAINKAIKNNDIESFCGYLTFFRENIIVIEVEDWKKIDRYIVNYYNCDYDDIKDLGYRENFINKYLNFFNIINFDLRIFQGINILNSKDDILIIPYYCNEEYNEAISKVIFKPYCIDSFIENNMDIMNLFFIINMFEPNKYMNERKYIVDFITCIESFLIKFDKELNSSISKQFKFKVKRCCKEFNYNVSSNEIDELYNYRSLIVHGNFNEINFKVNKIINKEWYKSYAKKINYEYSKYKYDNSDKEHLIYSRLYEIFNIIFKLYCDNKSLINELKNVTEKLEIENFLF